MKKFKFTLEPVLENYKFKEEQIKIKLAEKERYYQKQKAILHKLQSELTDTLRKMDEEKNNKHRIEIITLYQTYSEELGKKIEYQQAFLYKLKQEIEEIRVQLMDIVKNRKALEKLKENRWQEFKIEINRLEQKMIDEIATLQFTRHQQEA